MSKPLAPLVALFHEGRAGARLDELCEFAPAQGEPEEFVLWLVRLVGWLRPRRRGERARAKLRFFKAHLDQHPEWKTRVAFALSEIVRKCDVDHALTYAGIPRHFHLGGEVMEWLSLRALPTACRTTDAADILRLALDEPDAAWIGSPEAVALMRELVDDTLGDELERALGVALIDLAHQIVAQAQAPSVRTLARVERSPFVGLYDAVTALDAAPESQSAHQALLGRIRQCHLGVDAHRTGLIERGADLNTTFQLTRLGQQLDRLALLATLRHGNSDEALGRVLSSIVREASRNTNGKRLLRRSADLVVKNMVDSAATVGRAYLEDEHSSWSAAFRAGAGGGAIMAVATVVKCFLSDLHLPTLYEGLVYSLNYAAAFCAAYLLHFTIATKLPAHTAAALARAVQGSGGHRARLARFIAVWRSTARLQLAGLVGNVVVAGPLAYAIDLCFTRILHRHVATGAHAVELLQANSVLGPSIVFAAITGLFLWISSLIGAGADNWTRVVRLSDRLATNPRVMTRITPARARAFADAIVSRTGGLLGNLSLGFLLGGVPAAFAIARLPVEIRHVTVSTGSVALAISTGAGTHGAVVQALIGLAVIGFVNVAVSFFLALWLALRATLGMRTAGASTALVRLGLWFWLKHDRRAAPPKDTPPPGPVAAVGNA